MQNEHQLYTKIQIWDEILNDHIIIFSYLLNYK